jgi:hypothetical protein
LIGEKMDARLVNTPSDLSLLVLSLFSEMDREAIPIADDYPTGLWWYTGHLDRNCAPRKVQNSEVCWARRLAELLRRRGATAYEEHAYPTGASQRCDVVARLGFSHPVWIEVKGAWRAKFDPPGANTAYLKHLDAAATDVEKLSKLTPPDAGAVAFALIGFDQTELPIEEQHLSRVRTPIEQTNWIGAYAERESMGSIRFRTRIWVWSRALVTTQAR